jgi:hypothetical protein
MARRWSLVSLSDYDIFAYLMIGVAMLAANDLIFGTNNFFKGDWNTGNITITVVAAYVIGQVTAFGAAEVLERATASLLGRPIEFLVPGENAKAANWLKCIPGLGFYFDKLHDNTLAEIAKRNEKNLEGAELFWEAYNAVKQNENAFDRITTFSRLYHFCRNMAFASFLAAFVVVVVRIWRGSTKTPAPVLVFEGLPRWLTIPRWQFVAFTLVGVLLYIRYLEYFRSHSIEVLTTYAYLKM